MMKPQLLALMVGIAALAGCRSSAADTAEFDCSCGTPEAAIEGCLHKSCTMGETNADNPECACGTLTFGKEG